MALSRLDLPDIRAAVSDLHRILEDPTATNETARRVFRWSTGRTTLGEQDPTGRSPAALVGAGVSWVMFHFGDHIGDQCPEITDSQLDLQTKAALLELRGELLPTFAAHRLTNDAGVRVRFLVFLEEVLARIAPPAGTQTPEGGPTDRSTREPTGSTRPAQAPTLGAAGGGRSGSRENTTSIPPVGLDRPSNIHAAVIEVYEALRAVVFTAFPTTTSPNWKAPAEEAGRRLERLCAAVSRFPDRRLTPDPFVRPDPVRLVLGPSLPPIDGTSSHDALIRLAGRIHDGLTVVRLREMTCPKTGETFMGADYPNGYEYEGEVVIGGVPQRMMLTCPGSPATVHYSELPWSADLWDRLYESCWGEIVALYGTNLFDPDPGTFRVALEHEAALVSSASTPPSERLAVVGDLALTRVIDSLAEILCRRNAENDAHDPQQKYDLRRDRLADIPTSAEFTRLIRRARHEAATVPRDHLPLPPGPALTDAENAYRELCAANPNSSAADAGRSAVNALSALRDAWMVIHSPEIEPVCPNAPPSSGGGATTMAHPARATKGKNIDAKMIKVMADNLDSHGWSARQWADRLGCSAGTVKETKTWTQRLKAARAVARADATRKMGGTSQRGQRKARHKSDG